MNRLAILLFLFTMVIYSCGTCSMPCQSPASLGAHMRSPRGEAQNASTVALATASKPPFDEHGRALWWKAHNAVCEGCTFGGTVINCSYCNLVWHQTCAGLSAVPAGRARGKTESVFLSDLLYLFRLRLLYQICWGSWEQKT